MATPRERAVKMALRELEDWRFQNPHFPGSLESIIKNAVDYGYQAATMDMDARKRGIKCSLKSTKGRSQT